ncbi:MULTISPECIES: aminotransferase class IV [unclassified Kaistella]|uniref:aminotransferase class IV n=1 Tax=unclassified Kaistella TaxID=2762626 RepID=UPI0027350340|nr:MULTISPECIES: aminotransferase class IV [unclassified Kaistella]MDP2453569.1 aminotransferase class IV [Kaistella sp. SH11-4b]MDP2456626.1 aminotransferase class IV [Kaistella sp. SH40-3]MDP2459382.1 aminotransferase class IV [Kaistella sp. SH19-2b]
MKLSFASEQSQLNNRAFLYGDVVQVSFFIRNSQLIMAEECYFYLMASMRKMRMAIPLSYTLEFFQNLFTEKVLQQGVEDGIVHFFVYRSDDEKVLSKSEISFYFEVELMQDILGIQRDFEIDLIKEINVNTNVLSGIHVHSAENIYAEIYAKENDLDDVIFLNPNKRIARSIYGNLLFLEENMINIPKTTEGAYISPLLENFVTFVHKNNLAKIQESEMIAFESQKAEEVLLMSDLKGIFAVTKIRNKTFGKDRFAEMIEKWKVNFL